MRWPFGPPHLTLKTLKKKQNKTNNEGLGPSEVGEVAPPKKQPKQPQKYKENKKQKNGKKKKNTRKQKTQKYPKNIVQLSVTFFFCFWWVSKISFLTTWPKTRAPQKTL